MSKGEYKNCRNFEWCGISNRRMKPKFANFLLNFGFPNWKKNSKNVANFTISKLQTISESADLWNFDIFQIGTILKIWKFWKFFYFPNYKFMEIFTFSNFENFINFWFGKF